MLPTLEGHQKKGYLAAFSPDGGLVLIASVDRTAKLWCVASGERPRTLEGHQLVAFSAVFSSDGGLVLTPAGQQHSGVKEVLHRQNQWMQLLIRVVKSGNSRYCFMVSRVLHSQNRRKHVLIWLEKGKTLALFVHVFRFLRCQKRRPRLSLCLWKGEALAFFLTAFVFGGANTGSRAF